jgi:alginate O-acetyltransferase complex protein AlgI
MLFNSVEFIFAFLPITLIVYYWLNNTNSYRASISWLVLASLFFYSWWNPVLSWLIVSSILFNFIVGTTLSHRPNKLVLIFGIAVNLTLIGYYKYFNFFIDNMNSFMATDYIVETIILPLAISFFTFQQITYLVDAHQGKTKEYNFLQYCLFVTFFPQLIAGPIVHHKEMLPQFAAVRNSKISYDCIALGMAIFSIGLFKKVVLADHLALYASPYFAASADGTVLTIYEAWVGTLAYSFQLYFDFSGYSDMAIGLANMFGIRLPLNFFSPYKATSIIDFWRRWHITLSRFLRDYVYISLGGNRKGVSRRYVNLIVTMLLGGLWHGANWTFVFWGGLHGIYLVINQAWRYGKQKLGLNPTGKISHFASIMITFLAVSTAWVFFRAENFASAIDIFKSMYGLNGLVLPGFFEGKLNFLPSSYVSYGFMFVNNLVEVSYAAIWIVVAIIIIWFMPNTIELMNNYQPTYDKIESQNKILWKPDTKWAVAISIVFVTSVLFLSSVSEFLYFQF